jgi:hypothetical protein
MVLRAVLSQNKPVAYPVIMMMISKGKVSIPVVKYF